MCSLVLFVDNFITEDLDEIEVLEENIAPTEETGGRRKRRAATKAVSKFADALEVESPTKGRRGRKKKQEDDDFKDSDG